MVSLEILTTLENMLSVSWESMVYKVTTILMVFGSGEVQKFLRNGKTIKVMTILNSQSLTILKKKLENLLKIIGYALTKEIWLTDTQSMKLNGGNDSIALTLVMLFFIENE